MKWLMLTHSFCFSILPSGHGLWTPALTVVMGLSKHSCLAINLKSLSSRAASSQLFGFFFFLLVFLFVGFSVELKLCHRFVLPFHVQICLFVFSTLKLRVKGLFLKWIAERPECFQSPVFTRILYFKTESSLTFKFEDDSLFLPSVYLFCTCIFIYSPLPDVCIWTNPKLWFCHPKMLVLDVPQSYFLHFSWYKCFFWLWD